MEEYHLKTEGALLKKAEPDSLQIQLFCHYDRYEFAFGNFSIYLICRNATIFFRLKNV